MPPTETSQLQLPCEGGIHCSDWLGRIVCGDNVEVLSGFPDACIDLVVTSPPYDDLRTYGGHSWNFEAVAAQLTRVLKPGGVIVWVEGDQTKDGGESLMTMRHALHFSDVCGLTVNDTMIYEKANYLPQNCSTRYDQCWEYMLVLSKGKPVTGNLLRDKRNAKFGRERMVVGGRIGGDGILKDRKIERPKEYGNRNNVWQYPVGGTNASNGHPAVMPLQLAKDHIASWSNPGDVVLDPFSGSGTTCKAAKELNRQWCGIEINPEYCKIAEARLSQDVLQLETCAMRPNAEVSRSHE